MVYTWANHDRARVICNDDKMTFDSRVLYPDDDFRMEYRGNLKEGRIPHGTGRLTLKNSEITFTGQWIDGKSVEDQSTIKGIEAGWRSK